MEDINFFAETNFRNQQKKFGIKLNDRRKHFYNVGKTGMGKTTMLENMAVQDIRSGKGLCIVDPHGEFAEKMLDFVPAERLDDVIYFNPADMDWPVAFNVMEKIGSEERHLVASGMMSVFKKIWIDLWSARMEYILNNTILALLEYPGSTLLGINRMLADKDFRKEVLNHVTDPVVKAFWTLEFARYNEKFQSEAIAPIQNKAGQFTSSAIIRNIIGQPKSTIDIRKIMDEGKILILNLSKGKIGEDNSRLLGALMVTRLQNTAMSRVDIPEEQRRDFFLYIDEFQNFATDSFKFILSEARKYRLCLILTHQYITQMEETVRDAIFGNVGTLTMFRVGAADAEFLESEFSPELTADDLVNIGVGEIYLKLMIDGIASRPFSAHTLPPIAKPEVSFREDIIQRSRKNYGVSKEKVEEDIKKWAEPIVPLAAGGPAGEKTAGFTAAPKPGFESECWECGQKTTTPFQPDGRRPVYCPTCLEKFKKGEILPHTAQENKIRPAYSVGPRPSEPPSMAERPRPAPPVRPERPSRPEYDRTRPGPERYRPAPRNFSRPNTPRHSEPVKRESLKPVSLSEALKSEETAFKKPKNERETESKKRKEVDVGGLREILEESLKGIPPSNKPEENSREKTEKQTPAETGKPNQKKVEPGEVIKF